MARAIFGMVAPADEFIDHELLDRFLTLLQHRGQHHQRWIAGGVGLGVVSHVAAEAVVESDGRFHTVADHAPGLGGGPPGLEAFRQGAPSDPSYAITGACWDAELRELTLRRDRFGTRPLYIAAVDRGVAFCTEIAPLLQLPGVDRSIDDLAMANLLSSAFDDQQSTLIAGLKRLAPAHELTWRSGEARTARYWRLDADGPTLDGSVDLFVPRFRQRFQTAVVRQCDGDDVGFELSGGLDSSSIAATAATARERPRPIETFSAVFPRSPATDERRYIEATNASLGARAHLVTADARGPLSLAIERFGELGFPATMFNLGVTELLAESASVAGVRVLLNGFDGDTTVSHGRRRIQDLAHRGRLVALTRELRGLEATYGRPVWPAWRRSVWRHGVERRIDASALGHRVVVRGHRARQRLRRDRGVPTLSDLVEPGFAADVRRTGRFKPDHNPATEPTERAEHVAMLQGGVMVRTLEAIDAVAGRHGVEVRFPFWDSELIEYCVSLPATAKLDRGWTRYILRLAGDELIDDVRWRREKSNFTQHFVSGLLGQDGELLQEILRPSTLSIDRFIVPDGRRALLDLVTAQFEDHGYGGVDSRAAMTVFRLAVLEHWLQAHANRRRA